MILIIRTRPTKEQIDEMLEVHRFYIKLAVDIERGILAVGSFMQIVKRCCWKTGVGRKMYGERVGIHWRRKYFMNR